MENNTLPESTPAPYAHNLVSSLYAMKGMIESYLLNREEGVFQNDEEVLEKSQEVLKKTYSEADQALRIVKKLGTLVQERNGKPGESKVFLKETWEEALQFLQKERGFSEIEILQRIPDSFPFLRCSKEDLKEIFYHLIQNALQALTGEGKIIIRSQVSFSTREEPYALIQVSDTGPGIPESVLTRLFEPFFTTKPKGRGNGLGLYLTRQLVQRNHGRITAASFTGAGTTFTLEFPLASERA